MKKLLLILTMFLAAPNSTCTFATPCTSNSDCTVAGESCDIGGRYGGYCLPIYTGHHMGHDYDDNSSNTCSSSSECSDEMSCYESYDSLESGVGHCLSNAMVDSLQHNVPFLLP